MSTGHYYNLSSSLISLLLILNYSWFCNAIDSLNDSIRSVKADNFYPAIGTWYGSPNGPGSTGGACGLAGDVANDPYYGFISAGNYNLFQSGQGCGTCYEVKCTENAACSGKTVKVTITDECPGCTDSPYHFDLSGIAFGALAKFGQADNLRSVGKINLQFRRKKCNYKSNIKFRIDLGSNRYYLAFVVENLNGYGDIARIDLIPSNQGAKWLSMQRSYGVTWKCDIPIGIYGPWSVRITGPENSTSVTAYNVIPDNWTPGAYYYSNVNF